MRCGFGPHLGQESGHRRPRIARKSETHCISGARSGLWLFGFRQYFQRDLERAEASLVMSQTARLRYFCPFPRSCGRRMALLNTSARNVSMLAGDSDRIQAVIGAESSSRLSGKALMPSMHGRSVWSSSSGEANTRWMDTGEHRNCRGYLKLQCSSEGTGLNGKPKLGAHLFF
jgi:hypothetical protein